MNKLIKQIEQAWIDVNYPGDMNIFIASSYDDEGITEYFKGTTWKGHTISELRAHDSAISSFFTPQAWLYWLPAYLIAALTDPDGLSQGIDSITCSLSKKCPEYRDKIKLLSNNQKIALVHFYEYIVNYYSGGEVSKYAQNELEVLTYLYNITNMS